MSKLIDTVVAHFSNKEIRQIRIEEWDVTLYAKNLSIDDKAKWLSRAKDDTTDYMVYSCIFGLTDAEGEAVFGIEDKVKLRKNTDPDILSRLANFVLNVEKSEEDREKNS